MNAQTDQTESNQRPTDKLAIVSLIIASVFIYLYADHLSFDRDFYERVRDNFTISKQTLNTYLSFTGLAGLIFGYFSAVRNRSLPRKISIANFWKGVRAGGVTSFTIMLIADIVELFPFSRISEKIPVLLLMFIVALIGALIFGLFGGVGGVILGRAWDNKKAAIVGGIVAEIILAPAIFSLSAGGCLLGC